MLDIIHIVIDIDNTILDGTTTHLKYCNLVSGRHIVKDQVRKFYIYHYYDWTIDDFNAVYEQYGTQMHDESLPLPGAIETIRELKKEHTITFMTARPEKYREVTINWLKRYNVPYDQLVMTEGKLDAFNHIQGDILIDDSPHYAEQFSKEGLLMILIDYPYNQSAKGQSLFRANSWLQINQFITQLHLNVEEATISL